MCPGEGSQAYGKIVLILFIYSKKLYKDFEIRGEHLLFVIKFN